MELANKKKKLIFRNIMVTGIATSLLSTAMTTALPPVVADFGISISMGQWMTSGYSLVMGIIMPLTAFLITKFPTKRLYLSGILCFILGELISIFSGNFGVMMVGRVFQACGNGVLVSMAQVIILSIFPKEEKGSMMGLYGLATAAAPVIAPTIAGILVDFIGWRAIFILTLVIMTVSLIMAVFVFEDVLELQDKKFDTLSFIGSIFAFGGVTLGIGNVGSSGIGSVQALLPLGIGIVAGILFVFRQLHLDKPFLDVSILRYKEYAISVISSMLLFFVMMGSSVLMPLYVQSVMGYSATVSGLVTLPGSLATALASPFAGKIYDKIGIKKLFVTGSALLLVSNIGMFFVTMSMPLFAAAAWNVIRNISIGCLMMPLLTWGTGFVRKEKVADASSLLTSLRTISGSIGATVFVSIMVVVGNGAADAYGDAAQMHGLNIAFISMAAGTLILLLIAIFGVDNKKNISAQS